MPTATREALLVFLPVAEAEQALDAVLAERGFERAELPAPLSGASIARSDTRYFDVEHLDTNLSIVREWDRYSDATPWGAALELAEGLPAAARMEMALPPALSVLARALSRRATVVGFAMRDRPWHLVGVVFRNGRAADIITAVKDRVVTGLHGHPRPAAPDDARAHVTDWLAPLGVSSAAIEALLGTRALPSVWRVIYLHA